MPDHLPGPSRRDLGAIRRRLPARATLVGAAAMGAAITIVGTVTAFGGVHLTAVDAQPKATGMAAPNVLSRQLSETERGAGLHPAGEPVRRRRVAYYGYLADGSPMLPVDLASPTRGPEDRARQEHLPRAAWPARRRRRYDYGTHFLYQGHEVGPRGYITRINLDADAAHRVTLLRRRRSRPPTCRPATCPLSTGPPGTRSRSTLLFTAEGNGTSTGGVWEATPGYPVDRRRRLGLSRPRRLRGRPGGLATATSGSSRTSAASGTASRPPTTGQAAQQLRLPVRARDPADLEAGGRLQVLQVDGTDGNPVTFSALHARPRPTRTSRRRSCGTSTRTATPSGPAGSRSTTPPSTGRRRSTPTCLRRPRAGRPSSGPRTASSAGHRLHGVLLHRDGRHERDARRTARRARRSAAGAASCA